MTHAGRPFVASGMRIERPALAETVARELARGSLLLVADGGFGKTTALQDGLAASGLRSAWVACVPTHAEPGALLAAVLDAVREAAPGVVDVLHERIEGPQPIAPSALAGQVVAECARLLAEPLVLVFDDAETLAGGAAVEDVVAPLLGGDGSLRVAVATRRPLGLFLGGLRAAGRVRELGPAELAFDGEECAALLRLRRGREPEPDEIAAVLGATEGWPLGIALLAGRSAAPAPAARALARAELLGYLEREYLAALDPAAREALVSASLTSSIDASAAAALELPGSFLEPIPSLAGFLSATPDGGVRLHPLLRELLAREEGRRPASRRRALRAALAAVREEQHHGAEAIELWLDAGEPERAAAAIVRFGPTAVRAAPEAVGAWLERLPAGPLASPPLLLLRGQVEIARERLAAGTALLERAIAGFGAEGDPAGEWGARLLLIDHLMLHGDHAAFLQAAEAGGMPPPEAGPAAFGVLFYRATGYAMAGRFEDWERLSGALQAAGPDAAIPLDLMRVCWVDAPRGRHHDAPERLLEALAALERSDPLNQRAVVSASLAMILTDLGRHAEAEAWWVRTAELVERDGREPIHGRIARLYFALSRAREGDTDAAARELVQAGPVGHYGYRAYLADAANARVAAARHARPTAVAAAERALERARSATIVDLVWALEESVPLLVDVGAPERAAAHLNPALAEVERVYPGPHGTFFRARVLALRAWVRWSAGDEAAALNDFTAAWTLAGPAAPSLVRRQWATAEPLLELAMRRRTLEPDVAMAAVAAANPTSAVLVRLTAHEVPAVRAAAIEPAGASGRADAPHAVAARLDDEDPAVRAAARRVTAGLVRVPLPLAVRVLGGFELRRGPALVERREWGRPHASTLVRFLLVQGDRSVPEEAIFAALWPDRPGASARGALQVAVSRARAVLDAPGATVTRLESAHRTYRLRLAPPDSIDATAFRAAAAAALAADQERGALLEHAAGLWGGDPLPEDRDAPWAVVWRNELTALCREVLGALVSESARAGDHARAAHAANRLVALDPLDESAHRHLMVAYARTGRRAHALRAYLECRHTLVSRLGIEPARETARLQARILVGEAV